jgi:mitochondrial fission protein ELM1
MRNEPVCRWIQKQANHPVRYVHIGRPWARLKNFDLVITQPQYRLPRRPNVLEIPLCMHRVLPEKLKDTARQWQPRLAHLPRPLIAVLIGGNGGPHVFDPETARRLAREATAFAHACGGSLIVSTSSRTSRAAAETIRAGIAAPAYVHLWHPQAENPYFAFLALADSFIVTCDSVSMLTEACATRKPVYLFDLGASGDGLLKTADLREVLRRLRARCRLDRLQAFLYKQMVHVPPHRMTRDVELVHHYLVDSGRAVWLGNSFPDQAPPPMDNLSHPVARFEELFAPHAHALCRGTPSAGQRWRDLENSQGVVS